MAIEISYGVTCINILCRRSRIVEYLKIEHKKLVGNNLSVLH